MKRTLSTFAVLSGALILMGLPGMTQAATLKPWRLESGTAQVGSGNFGVVLIGRIPGKEERQGGGGGGNTSGNRREDSYSGSRGNRDDDSSGWENRRDNRIDRAIAAASRRGRYLDAGPVGGSIFWVQVATPDGKVTYLVDGNTGQIVGQR